MLIIIVVMGDRRRFNFVSQKFLEKRSGTCVRGSGVDLDEGGLGKRRNMHMLIAVEVTVGYLYFQCSGSNRSVNIDRLNLSDKPDASSHKTMGDEFAVLDEHNDNEHQQQLTIISEPVNKNWPKNSLCFNLFLFRVEPS